jgi:hypothetical protein
MYSLALKARGIKRALPHFYSQKHVEAIHFSSLRLGWGQKYFVTKNYRVRVTVNNISCRA